MLDQIKTLIQTLPQAVEIHGEKYVSFEPPVQVECSWFPMTYEVSGVVIDQEGDLQLIDDSEGWHYMSDDEIAAAILKRLQALQVSVTAKMDDL